MAHLINNPTIIYNTDPKKELDDLFRKSLENPNPPPRKYSANFPPSFRDPTIKSGVSGGSVSHSRDGSFDRTTNDSRSSGIGSGSFSPPVCNPNLPPLSGANSSIHSRANSSPAVIGGAAKLSLPPGEQILNGSSQLHGGNACHVRGASDGVLLEDRIPSELLGYGSDFTGAGLPYYESTRERGPNHNIHGHRLPGSSDNLLPQSASMENLGPLPAGWEVSYIYDEKFGRQRFYINHNNRTTTWYDPRIPEEQQRERIMRMHMISNNNDMMSQQFQNPPGFMANLQQQQLQQQHQQQHHHQQQQQHQVGQQNMRAINAAAQGYETRPIQHAYDQRHYQHQQMGQLLNSDIPPGASGAAGNNFVVTGSLKRPGAPFSPSGTQDRVDKLQKEIEIYRQRQQELARSGLVDPIAVQQQPLQQRGYETNLTSSNHMLFPQQTAVYHSHTSSSDSGVGLGLHSGYNSLSTTPGDMLSSDLIDGIDLQDAPMLTDEDLIPTLQTTIDFGQYLNIR